MQIDEVDIIVIVISGGNCSNGKITLPAAKTSKGFDKRLFFTDIRPQTRDQIQ